jgi:hypothetical protein
VYSCAVAASGAAVSMVAASSAPVIFLSMGPPLGSGLIEV